MLEGTDERGQPIGPRRIEELWAWVVREPDGGDGVPAIRVPGFGLVPAMGADRLRVESLRPLVVAGTGRCRSS